MEPRRIQAHSGKMSRDQVRLLAQPRSNDFMWQSRQEDLFAFITKHPGATRANITQNLVGSGAWSGITLQELIEDEKIIWAYGPGPRGGMASTFYPAGYDGPVTMASPPEIKRTFRSFETTHQTTMSQIQGMKDQFAKEDAEAQE